MRSFVLSAICVATFAACLTAQMKNPADTPGGSDSAPSPETPYDPGTVPDVVVFGDGPVPQNCTDAMRCAQAKGCYAIACAGDCIAGLDEGGKAQLAAIGGCKTKNCGDPQDTDEATLAQCVYDKCRDEVEPCTVSGTATCVDTLLGLFGALGSSDRYAMLNCLDKASYDSRVAALAVAACVEAQCATSIGNTDQMMTCVTSGPCFGAMAACDGVVTSPG